MGTLTRRCRSVRIQVKDARQVKAPPAIVSSARYQRSELFRTYGLAAFRAVPCVRTVVRLVVRCCVRAWGGEGDGTDVGRRGPATSLPMHTASSGTVRAGCHRAWQGGDGIIRLALRILARSSKYVSLGCMQGRPQRRVLLIFLWTHVSLCPGDAGL